MPDPDIIRVNKQFQADLLQRERAAASQMVRFYGESWQRIRHSLDDLTAKIEAAKAQGKEIGPSWLFQENRLKLLQAQTEAEINHFAQYAERSIIQQQQEAVTAAQSHAQQLMLTGLGEAPPGATVTFAQLPTEAMNNLIGFSSDGSPLGDLLNSFGPEAGQSIRTALIAGVALGQNPRVIARSVRGAMGGNLARALTTARTEVLRSYREASRQTYEANSDIVKAWIRHEACDQRTCAFCFALHGKEYKLSEPFATHPACRGTLAPKTVSWADLGFKEIPETSLKVESGPSRFEKLPESTQEHVLGKAAFQAYKAGAVKLSDFVGWKRDKRWGKSGYAKSLVEILGKKRRDQWIGRAVQAQQDLPAAAAGS